MCQTFYRRLEPLLFCRLTLTGQACFSAELKLIRISLCWKGQMSCSSDGNSLDSKMTRM